MSWCYLEGNVLVISVVTDSPGLPLRPEKTPLLFSFCPFAVKDKQPDTCNAQSKTQKEFLVCFISFFAPSHPLTFSERKQRRPQGHLSSFFSPQKNHGSLATSPGPVWRANICLLSGVKPLILRPVFYSSPTHCLLLLFEFACLSLKPLYLK